MACKSRVVRIFLFFLLIFGFNHCHSFQQQLRFLDLSGGAEQADARFFVRAGQLEKAMSGRNVNYDNTIDLNKSNSTVDYFYSVGFFPGPVPFVGDDGVGRYMRLGFTLNSPRTFRGSLRNYPDDGRATLNPFEATTNLLFPLPPAFGRQTEFVFEEYRGYLTFFFPYYANDNWYMGLGNSFGQSKYNLDLLEGTNRVASTRSSWMALHAFQFVIGYKLGRFFDEGLFNQTYLYFELISDAPNRTRLDINMQRADGLPASSIYYRTTYTRIGIRKTVDMWTSNSDPNYKLKNRNRTTKDDDQPKTEPEPEPELNNTETDKTDAVDQEPAQTDEPVQPAEKEPETEPTEPPSISDDTDP